MHDEYRKTRQKVTRNSQKSTENNEMDPERTGPITNHFL